MNPGQRIAAGALSFGLDGADLVDVRWGSLDIAGRITVTVRDPAWGTIGSTLRAATVARVSGGVGIALEAVHEAVGFRWRATVEAFERGELVVAFDGAADRSFRYRRVGLCVEHPWRSYVGATYQARTQRGSRRGTFPMRIHPQARVDDAYLPMIDAFSSLSVAFPDGASLEMNLEGDLFELEDQRNWTDGSFKTYTTPLTHSEPRQMETGQHVRQRAVLRMEGAAPPESESSTPVVTVGTRSGRTVPPVGMSATAERIAGAAHIRVPLAATEPAAGLTSLELPVELALFVDPDEPAIDRVTQQLTGVQLARVLVLRTDERTSSPELVDDVRARFGSLADGVPFLGGTSTSFSEVNRNPPDPGLDGVAFAVSPEVHGTSERSIRESIEILPQVLAQGRAMAHAPVHVSPVTLSADHRVSFADAWTIACLATLIGSDAATITVDASSDAAGTIAGFRGVPILDTHVSDPSMIAALGLEDQGGRRALVVNLTGEPTPFRLNDGDEPPLAPYELRSCDVSTASS